MTSNFRPDPGQKAPKSIFVATTIVIFFLSLSAADSVGFVPCYIDGTECSSKTAESPGIFDTGREVVALSDLPELDP